MNHQIVVPARKNDVAALSAMLARSFLHDPGLAWMVPDERVRALCLPRFFRGILRGTLRHGVALCARDNQAISLWRSSGAIYPGVRELLGGLPFMLPFLRHCGRRAQLMGKAVREHAPALPFRYLQFAGVEPEQQGQGLGGAVVRAGLESAARARESVYLETPKPANVAFYRHLGFDVVSEWSVEGGPRFTSMLKRAE